MLVVQHNSLNIALKKPDIVHHCASMFSSKLLSMNMNLDLVHPRATIFPGYLLPNTGHPSMARCAQVAKLAKLAATGPAAPGHAALQPSIQQCLGRLPQLQGSDVVDLTRSLARLRWRDEATWKEIGSTVTQKVEEMKVGELVEVAGAFSVASQPECGDADGGDGKSQGRPC